MSTANLEFTPNYASPPGDLIQDHLEVLGISARELARRCGRSAKLITEIIAGKAPLEPATALQLEQVLQLDASIWMRMEADYRLHLAREAQDIEFAKDVAWVKGFPTSELQRRGYLKASSDPSEQVRQFLGFMGVANGQAAREKMSEIENVAFRHSPSFQSRQESIFVWLRIGELEAEGIETANYDRAKFLSVLQEIRALTIHPIDQMEDQLRALCASAGVAFVIEDPFEKLPLSGISRWLSPKKALIQQTFRHLVTDHFWFTFFHEAAHLLLHSRKSVYIDLKSIGNAPADEESEANRWAADFLVPTRALETFILDGIFSESTVRQFAKEVGVHAGIVVGQLQHRGLVPFNRLTNLKDHYERVSSSRT